MSLSVDDTIETETEPELLPDEPKRRRRSTLGTLPPMPAMNGADPEASYSVHLRQVSLGKPVSNVSATLTFDLDIPEFDVALMGMHAFTLQFLEGFLGDGALIKEAPTKADDENNVHQQLKIRIPRFLNENYDQILACIAPLVGGKKLYEPLFGLDWSWRLNIPVDIPGELRLYAMQQKFDLTSRAE